jgi:hypothetical protein
MKKLILSATLMAFAIAVQAGEAKTANGKDKSACCAEKAVMQTKAASGTCPIAAQQAKNAKTCSATTTASACSGATACNTPTKQALLSPKAAAEVTKRL